jgi:hypothetical protein
VCVFVWIECAVDVIAKSAELTAQRSLDTRAEFLGSEIAKSPKAFGGDSELPEM